MRYKRLVSFLLALALLAGLLPAVTLGASAADAAHTITVSADAPAAAETTQGIQYLLAMSDVFTDSEQHEMTYTLSGENLSSQTKIAENKDDGNAMYLFFVQPNVGEYALTITAACTKDETVTASHTITITVKEGKDGDPRQYNYDETDASSVTVYVTISSDGVPLMGKDGTILAHLPVKVPYFDLANQGLEKFYRYQTKDGRGEYINRTIVRRPTALHLYLYLLGVYYLAWKRYNDLEFIQCACRFTENCTMCDNGGGGSKRQEIKTLLRRLRRDNPNLEKSIFNAIHSVCLDTMVGYKSGGIEHTFTEIYNARGAQ